jgi:DNA (cytosine-5)-methyltransferase 1
MGVYVFCLSHTGGCVVIVDLFAGPGGWSEGLRMLSPELHATEIGLEWDAAACETRAAAGHATIRTDIAAYPLEQFGDRVTGLIASPPCQDFSLAGKRAGIEGERGQLIREVLRWSEGLRPEWIACEQVPPALPVWRDYETELRKLGYFTWSGVLNAADYGVPQTRRRAILLASRMGPIGPPEPTHDREPMPSLFADELQPWVSMAEALGWERNERGEWILNSGKCESQPNRAIRSVNQPAPTLAFGHDSASWRWELQLNTGRSCNTLAEPEALQKRSISEPAPTSDTKIAQWHINTGRAWVKGGTREDAQTVPASAPAPALTGQAEAWWFTRPATTLVGSFCPDIVAGPGVDLTRPRQDRAGSVRISVNDALVLQSFPPDYPLQGSKTKQFQQVGNAVPPRLAAHILARVTGKAFNL